MRDKSLLEVSMMLGDAIDKLNALSAYKPDPYAHLKEAQERGEVIQVLVEDRGGNFWSDRSSVCNMLWNLPPDRYRIKPKAMADDDIDWNHKTVCEFVDNNYWHNPEDAIGDIRKMVYKEKNRIKPKTKTLYLWAVSFSDDSWSLSCYYYEDEKDALFKTDAKYVKRLDYTAIEVEA